MGVPNIPDFNGGVLPVTTITAWLAGIRFGLPSSAIKAADQTVNNSSTFINDAALFVPVAANAIYRFELILRYSTNTTANIKTQWTFPTGLAMKYNIIGIPSGSTTLSIFAWDNGSSFALSGNAPSAQFTGKIAVGSTAGTLQFQWAQNLANASNTIVQADSYLALSQIG